MIGEGGFQTRHYGGVSQAKGRVKMGSCIGQDNEKAERVATRVAPTVVCKLGSKDGSPHSETFA